MEEGACGVEEGWYPMSLHRGDERQAFEKKGDIMDWSQFCACQLDRSFIRRLILHIHSAIRV